MKRDFFPALPAELEPFNQDHAMMDDMGRYADPRNGVTRTAVLFREPVVVVVGPACMGICCPVRASCARHAAIDGAYHDDRIAHCGAGISLPGFVSVN